MTTNYQRALGLADHIAEVDESPRELVKQLRDAGLLAPDLKTVALYLLAAAAPVLAEQIAGMQWEYGVDQYTLDNPHWHTAIPYDRGFDKDKCTQLAETFRANNPHNKYRIVRRLVSEPEVID